MKQSIHYFYISLIFFQAFSLTSQTIELQGNSTIDCFAQTYCLTLEIKSGESGISQLGSSSIFFHYDSAAISFQNYTSTSFDSSTDCFGATPWDVQTFDAGQAGKFSLTMILKDGEELQSCPEIRDTAWVQIGDVCFIIEDDSKWPDIHFDSQLTAFNQNTSNDGNNAFIVSKMQIKGATCQSDMDLDGVPDNIDNCVSTANPFQEDDDADGNGNSCDSICNIEIFSIPDLTICNGNTAVLSAFSEAGVAPYTYAWSNGSSEGNVEVSPNIQTGYLVTITDGNGCIGKDSVQVSVTEGFVEDLIIYNIDTDLAFDTIQNNDTFYLSSLPLNYNIETLVSGDVESVSYVLTGTDFDTDTENGYPYRYPSNTSPLRLMPGAYTLESGIFSENNQLGSNCDTRTVSFFIIDDCAKVDLGENRVQCDNDSTFIQAIVTTTHGPFNLSWSTGGTESSISVSPMEDDIYTVTISDNTNCTSEFSIGVEVTDAKIIDFYIWDNAADTVFRKINDNDIVVVSEIPGNWNMLTDYEGLVDRVDYELRGDLYYNYTEYNVPYHFVGDNSNVGFIGLGSYILTAYPKETHSVESIGCAPFEKSFQIVDSAGCNMVTTTLDSLPGSLNYALQCVESGGTIFFSSSIHRDTIKLVNHMPTIDKEVTISAISEQPVFIQGLGTSSVFNISPSGQVTIRGLHILPGTANTGASIINNGILDLKDVTLHKHPSQTQSEQIQNNGTLTVQGVLQIKNE